MKKRLIALLACAALLFALCAGCASDKPSDNSAPIDNSAPVEQNSDTPPVRLPPWAFPLTRG